MRRFCVVMFMSVAARAEWSPPRPAETALLILAEAAIIADCWQTLDIKNHPPMAEWNPLLGSHPSNARIFGMCSLSALSVAAGWYLLPTPWRDSLVVGVAILEIPTVIYSASLGLTMHF